MAREVFRVPGCLLCRRLFISTIALGRLLGSGKMWVMISAGQRIKDHTTHLLGAEASTLRMRPALWASSADGGGGRAVSLSLRCRAGRFLSLEKEVKEGE